VGWRGEALAEVWRGEALAEVWRGEALAEVWRVWSGLHHHARGVG
jgi:hypothetical protein